MKDLTIFNNRLLDSVQEYYGGKYYPKILKGIEKFNETQSLKEMVEAMFPAPEEPVAPNMGSLQIEQQVSEVVNLFESDRQEEANALADQTYRSIQIENSPSRLAERRNDEQIRYKVMFNFLRNFGTQAKTEIPVKTLDGLSFFGVVSLLGAYLQSLNTEANFNVTPLFEEGEDNGEGTLSLPTKGIKELASKFDGFKTFLVLNKSAKIPVRIHAGSGEEDIASRRLPTSLNEILNRSFSVWEPLLNVDPTRVEALSDSQKVLKLLENKTTIYSQCLNEMFSSQSYPWEHRFPSDLGQDKRNLIGGFVEKINDAIALRNETRSVVETLSIKTQKKKRDILKIFEDQGQSLKSASLNLLKITCQSDLNQTLPQSPQESILLGMLQDYQSSFLKEAAEKEKLKKLSQDVNEARGKLEDRFTELIHSYENENVKNLSKRARVLDAYVVFGFVLFNKDIFPSVSFKGETKKLGRDKIKSLTEKFLMKKAFGKLKAPQTVKNPFENIHEVFENQMQKMFKTYTKPSQQYKYINLSEKDIKGMQDVLKGIQEQISKGDVKAVEKFNQLEGVIERFFVENNSFQKALENTRRADRSRISALQRTMQAALFLVNEDVPVVLGQDNSEVFKKLINSILKSISPEGIKEKITTDNKKILRAIEGFSRKEITEKSITDLITNDIQKQINKAKPASLKYNISRDENVFIEINKWEYMKERLKSAFWKELFSEENRWTYTYSNPMEILQGPPPIGNVSRTAGHWINDTLLGTENRAMSEEIEAHIPKDYKTLYKNFRAFYRKAGYLVEKYEERPKGLVTKQIDDRENPDMLLLPSYVEIIDQKIEQIRSNIDTYVVNTDPFAPKQVDLLSDQTIFKFFNKVKNKTSRDANFANSLYDDFLPTFLYSFVTVGEVFPSYRDQIIEQKIKFIEQMPNARLVQRDIENFQRQNQVTFIKLQEWVNQKVNENLQLLQGDPEEISNFLIRYIKEAKKYFWDLVDRTVEAAYTFVPDAVAITSLFMVAFVKMGIFAASGSFFPMLAACSTFGIIGACISKDYIRPFIRKFANTSIETIQGMLQNSVDAMPVALQNLFNEYSANLTGAFSPSAPATFLLDMMQQCFLMEQKMIERFDDPKHQLLSSLFSQEMFQLLTNVQNDFSTFPQRIAALTPNATEHANFSVMCLNMWHMLNKDIFRVVPNEILRAAHHKDFSKAVGDFLIGVKEQIDSLGAGFSGEKLLDNTETPYFRFLLQKTKDLSPTLRFFSGSSVSNVLERDFEFKITDEILKMEIANPFQATQNINQFLDVTKELLKEKPFFEYQLRKTIGRQTEIALLNPMEEDRKSQTTEALISSFEFLKLGFLLAREWENPQTEYKDFIKSSKESPKTILASSLFQASLSLLSKTAQTTKALGLPQGGELLEKLDTLRTYQETFLETGELIQDPFSSISEMTDLLRDVIEFGVDQNQVAFYPVMAEIESFPETTMLIALRKAFKDALGPEAKSIIPFVNSNRVLYLTNNAAEVYFLSAETRGYAFSPFFFNAAQGFLKDSVSNEISLYMGNIAQINQELRNQEQRLPRWYQANQRMQGREQGSRALPPSSSLAGQNRPIPENQSFVGKNIAPQMIDPATGLVESQYDPQETGASPLQAAQYLGYQLPQGVRSQIQAPAQEQAARNQLAQNAGIQPVQPPNQSNQQPNIQPQQIPLILPMGGDESQVPGVEAQVPGQQVSQNENPLMVGVNAQGGSQVISGGGKAPAENYGAEYRRENPAPAPIPNRMPAGQPFQNLPQQDYDPVQEIPQAGGGWGRAAAIGGGAMLGAGLLAYGLSQSGNNQKKRKK